MPKTRTVAKTWQSDEITPPRRLGIKRMHDAKDDYSRHQNGESEREKELPMKTRPKVAANPIHVGSLART